MPLRPWADRLIGVVIVWQTVYVVMALIGLYLTYVGWKPAQIDVQGNEVHITVDFPHAA